MKIKTKNNYDFKIKCTHNELQTIYQALEDFDISRHDYRYYNGLLYDRDELKSQEEFALFVSKLKDKIKKKLDKVIPY